MKFAIILGAWLLAVTVNSKLIYKLEKHFKSSKIRLKSNTTLVPMEFNEAIEQVLRIIPKGFNDA